MRFCRQCEKLVSCLNDEQLGRLFRHIFTWLNDGSLDLQKEEQLVESDILLAFRFMRLQINIDIEKYQKLCEKRKEAANKRWENHSKNANASFAMHKKENENEIEKENENEKEIENEKENESENENENESSSCAAVVISEPVANAEEAAAAAAASFNIEEAKEYCLKNVLPRFNSILDNADSKIPRIQDFNDQRTERYVAVHKKYGIKKIEKAFRNAARSPFLNGNGKRNTFVASFDWILDEEHFLKVCEGEYNTHR